MLSLDAAAQTQSQANVAALHYLVELFFSTGTLRYTTYSTAIVHGGNTYTGLGDLVSVGDIKESLDQGADKLELGFSIVNTAMLAAMIGPATVYRGLRVNVYGQFIDGTFQPAGAAKLRFSGYMDAPRVERESPGEDGSPALGRIVLPCWRAGQARMRNASGLRRTHAQQMQRTTNADTGLRYTQQLIEQPSLWLSKRFQQV